MNFKILYLLIITTSTFFAFLSQKESFIATNAEVCCEKKYITNKKYFLIAVLIPWFFLAFTNIGVDYKNYYIMTERLTWSNFATIAADEEPIFNLFCLIIRSIVGNNTNLTLFVLKTISIVLFAISVYMMKDNLRLGFSFFAYLLLVYIPSFYLIAICLAASVVYLAFSLWVKKRKAFWPLVLIIFAAQLHNSMYLILPMFCFCLLINRKDYTSNLNKFLFTAMFIAALFFATTIFEFAMTHFSWFHFSGYLRTSSVGSGLMVIPKYLPLFLGYYLLLNKVERNSRNDIYVFIVTSFAFNILSYRFNVIQRIELALLPLFSLYMPIVLESRASKIVKRQGVIELAQLLILVYLIFRGVLIINEFVKPETGMMTWIFYNPMTSN